MRTAGLVALALQFLDDADPHALDLAEARGLDERADGVGQRRRVVRVVPADDLVQQGAVEDGAGDGADLVERGRHRDRAVAGHTAVGGLHADGPGDGAGLADGAAGVGAEGQGRLEGGDGRGGPAAGTAGDAVEVPGVAGGTERGVLGGGAHGELVEVGLAEDRHPRGAEPADHGGVVGALPALEDLQ